MRPGKPELEVAVSASTSDRSGNPQGETEAVAGSVMAR